MTASDGEQTVRGEGRRGRESLHLHFVGIGGIGMSAIARLAAERGYRVSGCDLSENREVLALRASGIPCSKGHDPSHVPGVDVMIRSSAIPLTHPEIVRATTEGVPVFSRIHMLARVMRGGRSVGVAGCHGKTTTTWLVASVLIQGGYDPTVMLGGNAAAIGGNFRRGNSEWFVVEVDESDGLFREIHPDIAVITNVDRDHLDHYRDLAEIEAAFARYAGNVRAGGRIIVCADDAAAMRAVREIPRERLLFYGTGEGAFLRASDVRLLPDRTVFRVRHGDADLGEFEIRLLGMHNMRNALAAIGTAMVFGAPVEAVRRALARTERVDRRLQILARERGITVIDDYAHHPTEIAATLAAARLMTRGRILAVFQPHRYSRVEKLAVEFGPVLAKSDRVFLAPLYPAGEAPIPGVSSQRVADAIRKAGDIPVILAEDRRDIPGMILREARDGDVVLVMGAGDVVEVGRAVAGALKNDSGVGSAASVPDGEWPCPVRREVPLAACTTFAIGGPAEYFAEPSDADALLGLLKFARGRGVPVRFLGNGSNLLIADEGVRGLVIRLGKGLDFLRREGDEVVAGAGLDLARLVHQCQEWGLGGCECLAGIPGTVGGALVMNAGTRHGCIGDVVREVCVADAGGAARRMERDALEFRYRGSNLRGMPVLDARLALRPADPAVLRETSRGILEKRRETQPLGWRNAGCVFKNPPGAGAGRLIDEAGLKGFREGGVRVSEIHANFIVNDGRGTARDVRTLIERVREAIRVKHGIVLETEIEFW
ncbi:MAG: UDP-N-acetylmuramate--L-alanine ligase [Planctomycetota bacterium]